MACIGEIARSLAEGTRECECPSPCLEYVYETVLSYLEWPADNYVDLLLDKTCDTVPHHCDELWDLSYANLRKNYAKVNIFYRDLNYEKLEDEPELPADDLLSALGGTVAFWIGVSILGLAEILQLIVQTCILLLHKCLGRCNDPHVF